MVKNRRVLTFLIMEGEGMSSCTNEIVFDEKYSVFTILIMGGGK